MVKGLQRDVQRERRPAAAADEAYEAHHAARRAQAQPRGRQSSERRAGRFARSRSTSTRRCPSPYRGREGHHASIAEDGGSEGPTVKMVHSSWSASAPRLPVGRTRGVVDTRPWSAAPAASPARAPSSRSGSTPARRWASSTAWARIGSAPERRFGLIAQPEAQLRGISPAPASAGSGPQEREDLRVLPLFAFGGDFASSLTLERGFPRQLPKMRECVRRCGRSDAQGRHRRRILASVRDKAAFVAENASLAKPPAGASAQSRIFWQQGAERVPKRVLKGFRLPDVSVVCAHGQARRISSHTIRYGAGPPARSARCVLCDRNLSCDSCAKRTAPCFMSCSCSHEAGGGCLRTGFPGRSFLSGAS